MRPARSETDTGARGVILLVEDQDAVRRVTARILETHGYRVHQVRDGGEALALLRDGNQTIHLMLSDIVMPHMSGVELGRRVARAYPSTKILYMSGYSSEVVSMRDAGERKLPIIAKPFLAEQLLTRVREALGR